MPFHNTRALLQDAAKADYAVGSFLVSSPDQVEAVLHAAEPLQCPVNVRLEVGALADQDGDFSNQSPAGPFFQAVVRSPHQLAAAAEKGVRAYAVPNDANIIRQARRLGGFVEIPVENVTARQLAAAAQAGAQGVRIVLPATRGAFTGSHYLQTDAIRDVAVPPGLILALEVPNELVVSHIHELARLPVSQLVFDVRSVVPPEVSQLVARVLPVLVGENTATMYAP